MTDRGSGESEKETESDIEWERWTERVEEWEKREPESDIKRERDIER